MGRRVGKTLLIKFLMQFLFLSFLFHATFFFSFFFYFLSNVHLLWSTLHSFALYKMCSIQKFIIFKVAEKVAKFSDQKKNRINFDSKLFIFKTQMIKYLFIPAITKRFYCYMTVNWTSSPLAGHKACYWMITLTSGLVVLKVWPVPFYPTVHNLNFLGLFI